MPRETEAMVMPGPGVPVEMRTLPLVEPEPGGVVLETLFSEVCGTDVHLHHGRLAGVPYPIIPGHVSVGRIGWMNGKVRDINGEEFRVGDVVTFLDVHGTCGNCWHCLVGKNSTRCPERKVYGITYGLADGVLGGWSRHITIKPGVKMLRLPAGLLPETFIGGGCGAPTAFHALQRAGLRLNDVVLVQGTGPVGLSAIAFARISGASTIIAIGAPTDRLELAKAMGADICLNVESTSAGERLEVVRAATGKRGADVVIEATGNPAAVSEGLDLVRDAGTYVVVGQYTDCGGVELNPHTQINRKHVDVRGCWGSDYSHFHGAVAVMARHQGAFAWHRLAEHQYPLERAGEALADIEGRRVAKAVIRWGGG